METGACRLTVYAHYIFLIFALYKNVPTADHSERLKAPWNPTSISPSTSPITEYGGFGITGKCKEKQCAEMSAPSSTHLDTFPKGNSQGSKKMRECSMFQCSMFYVSTKHNKEDTPPLLKFCFVPLENGKRVLWKSKEHAFIHLSGPRASNSIQGVWARLQSMNPAEVFSNGAMSAWSLSPLEERSGRWKGIW